MSSEHINRFSTAINNVSESDVITIPNLADRVRHDGKYTRLPLNIDAGYVDIDNSNFIPRDYKLYKLRAVGRENSRHQVHFGALDGRIGEQTVSLDVAVKDSHMSLALGEIAMMHYFESLDLPTFQLIGMLVRDDIHPSMKELLTHIITKFNQEVVTMDTLDWDGMSEKEMQEQISLAAISLAGLNGRGISHGDAELKNFGQKDDGETFLIDLELASSYDDIITIANCPSNFGPTAAEKAQERLNLMIRREIRDLINSIEPYLQKRGKKTGAIYKFVNRTILEPYRAGLVDLPYEKNTRVALVTAAKVFERESKS